MREDYLKIILLILLAVIAIQGYYLYDIGRSANDKHASVMSLDPLTEVQPFADLVYKNEAPFKEIERLRREMQKNFMDFENFFQTTPSFDKFSSRLYRMPRFDMKEQDSKYIITIELPGLDKNAIDIKTDNRLLIVSAKVSEEKDNNTTTYYRHERSTSSYKRVIQLPLNTNVKSLKSNYKDGILTITFDKKSL